MASVRQRLAEQGVAEPTARAMSVDAICSIRREKLPDPVRVSGNAGSFFKNPVVSAELVERIRAQYPAVCGLSSGRWPGETGGGLAD